MKRFNFVTAINQLQLDKEPLNTKIKYDRIPEWVQGEAFLKNFLPYIKVVGDSREQDHWVEKACEYYGLAFEWARKDEEHENLKEGDYTVKVCFGNKVYDFTGLVAYERKGSVSEFYNNCLGGRANGKNDRNRVQREFQRFKSKGYEKVVLMLEFGETLTDLINMEFSYRVKGGAVEVRNTNYTMYSTVMAWKQPNCMDFDVIQSNSHTRLFWLFLQDFYYYFRNVLREECEQKGLIG